MTNTKLIKSLTKDRTCISMFYLEDSISFKVQQIDLITDETEFEQEFGNLDEAIEYFSDLYDTI